MAPPSILGFFDQNEINKIMEESVKMKQFNHPNVMNLIGVCINAGPAPYIVMPFMANGSLLSYLRKERPNLLLDETADEDLVRVILLCLIFSHTNLPTACQLLALVMTAVKMSAKVSDFKLVSENLLFLQEPTSSVWSPFVFVVHFCMATIYLGAGSIHSGY